MHILLVATQYKFGLPNGLGNCLAALIFYLLGYTGYNIPYDNQPNPLQILGIYENQRSRYCS